MLHHAGRELPFDGGVGDQAAVVVQAGEHPEHVAVHCRDRDAEADGRNGPGRVVPDAGQGPQGIVIGGQPAAVLLADDAGRLLQVAHPAVITKALPQFVELFLLTGGQSGNVRQRGQKTLVIRQRSRNAGLLQHDLAQPDMIGAGVGAERQHALVCIEPIQQCRRDVFHEMLPRC